MQKSKFYITTPLYYVNSTPHIGHSYTNIAADTLARFHRGLGDEVYFLTGTDEHGQKIARAAHEASLSEKDFTDKMVSVFRRLWEELDISYDDFIRTTEKRHTDTVKNVLNILFRNQDIYPDKYEGWYCTPCETFWTDSQAADNLCPDCRRPVERIQEENYFFRLSKYQDWLLEHIRKHSDFVRPVSRYNEVLSFLENNKLSDLCVSRPKQRLSWGIELPFSPNHVTYVWFDALVNYISAVGFGYDEAKFKKYWPADLHLIGKDILRQHAVIWPIILRALGLEMPRMIFAHGWWMVGEDKMSKSRGNVVDPLAMVEKYGIDTYRYFLLRDVPFGLDGSFSDAAIIKRRNSDLANDLGNLIHRTSTMVEKYFSTTLPREGSIEHFPLKAECDKLENELKQALGNIDFSSSLDRVWQVINQANKFIEDTKPWNLLKEGKKQELDSFILLLVYLIRRISGELSPFMPRACALIKEQFSSSRIKKGTPLFPRIEDAL